MLPPAIADYVTRAKDMGATPKQAIRDAVMFYRLGELPPNYPVPTAIRIDDKWRPAPYVLQWHWVTFRLAMGWGID